VGDLVPLTTEKSAYQDLSGSLFVA
jgi:hypothetical protein